VRFGLFVAILATVFGVIALALPIPRDFRTYPGGPPTALTQAPRCLTLSYAPESVGRYLPRAVRLLPPSAGPGPYFSGAGVYAADLFGRLSRDGAWRPAGPDSVDLRWYHSPTLRLPVVPELGGGWMGRGAYEGARSLYSDLFAVPPFAVSVAVLDCSAFDTLTMPFGWRDRWPSGGPTRSVAG
jgi:hypothetical protein